MTLGANNVQAARFNHLFVAFLPFLLDMLPLAFVCVFPSRIQLGREAAAQHDIRTTTRHVGGDGHGFRPAGIRHDDGFTLMLLGVEHFVFGFELFEHAGQ